MRVASVVLALLVSAPATAAADTASEVLARLSADQREQLSEERMMLIEGADDSKLVSALVLFSLPPDQVLPLVAAASRQTEYRPELKKSETLETFADGVIAEQRMKVAFVKLVFHLRFVIDTPNGKVSWQLADGYENDLQEATGYWQLHALKNGGTLAEFGTRVDVGALPGFLQDFATRKNVPKTLERTRMWVDSGGTWRP